MAIYEYSCPNCGHFEVFQRMSEAPLANCPECEKRGVSVQVKRLISAPAFHLKGSGWYKTDYASSSSSASGLPSSNGNSSKKEKKEESKQVSSDNEGSKPKVETPADSSSKATNA